ncbi:hypothetical protein [Marinoscillum sp. MHG1-6]|uniref:hypothetical protein n=1 Tax=Marinoscillum sp. MHG1-6 TaxID=2959627 RepID=UPI002158301C|nr:hypothetical protein [Marinoscillum sp. MHG1-6]
MYPIITCEESDYAKEYRINFRDFQYCLVVRKGKGFGVSLTLDRKGGGSSGDQRKAEDVLKVLTGCYAWVRRMEKYKINQLETEFEFKFIRASGSVQFVAINKKANMALVYSHSKNGYRLTKNLDLITDNIDSITYNPFSRNTKDITPIQKWQCYQGWSKILDLLEALKVDMEKQSGHGDKKSLSGREQLQLVKQCEKYHISAEAISSGTRRGLKVFGKQFWNIHAINNIVEALVEERKDNYFPSYDIFSDGILSQ